MLDVLTITDSSGNAIAISAAKTFTMPESDVTVSGTFKFARLVMLSGPSINTILVQNNVQSIVTKFIHSATPPETGIATYKLSADNSDVDVLAWLDGTTIKFYAEGYTDSNRKIPLNADSSLMFAYCRNLTSIDFSVFDTTNVTDMSRMFCECSNFTSLDLSSFNTKNVTDMHDMFFECSNLASLNLSSFDTSNVTDMSRMFFECSNLTSLDLSSFYTSNVTDIRQMFMKCSKIEKIFASSNFVTTAATTHYNMFVFCNSLIGGAGTTYDDTNFINDIIYARIDDPANGNPGYFTRK